MDNSNEIKGKGTLYIISTPIGNIRDITLRALDILGEVALIAAEDTRVSRKLLSHYGISARMESFHKFNEESKKSKLLKVLLDGKSVALISDSGTPGISDPAFSIVREVIKHNIPITSVPGANSIIPALVLSGLPTDKFYFGGFPPVKSGPKRRFFEELKDREETLIFFESPHRLLKTINTISEALGDRECSICRELTKKYEEIFRGRISHIIENADEMTIRGEFVLVVSGNRK